MCTYLILKPRAAVSDARPILARQGAFDRIFWHSIGANTTTAAQFFDFSLDLDAWMSSSSYSHG